MKFIFVFFGLLCAFSSNAQTRSETKYQAIHDIIIKVNQKDDISNASARSLTFTFSELSSRQYKFKEKDTSFNDNIDGQLLILSIPASRVSMKIGYRINGTLGKAYDFSREYLINSVDTIEMDLFKDSLVFLGKNALELNLQYELFNMQRIPVRISLKREDPQFFANEDSYLQLALDKQLAFIEHHKKHLTDRLYQYLRNQSIGYRYYRRVANISNYFILGLGDRGAEYYLSNPIKVPLTDDKYLHEAPSYIDFLYFKERLDYELENRGSNGNILEINTGADKILDRISQKYTGDLRDRLLIVGINSLSTKYIDAATYFSKHETLIPKSSLYYHLFEQIKEDFQPNQKVDDFALPDTSGKTMKLSDFKGKVVVLDLWFTGCIPCRLLKKLMEPVVEQFKIRNDVVFMTLSVDKYKEQWMNSVKAGEYTHPTAINLLAGPGHPIIKKYNITGFPRLMLIDKNGRLIAMKLPVPNDDRNKEYLTNAIKALL